MLTVKAYAKINIVLEILRRRNDGYHDIASIIQAIDLHDIIRFERTRKIQLFCDNPSLNSRDNLVVKAAELLRKVAHYRSGVTIHLQKRIPVAAGLGGGSSDAAATLLALNELWGLKYSVSQLHHIASDIGFDVPFFLYKSTALVEGRGDWITPLPAMIPQYIILFHPTVEIPDKTRRLYSLLSPAQYSSGSLTLLAAGQLKRERIISPNSYFNAFELVAHQVFPVLDELRQNILSAGVKKVHLTGSGPTLYSIMSEKDVAENIIRLLKQDKLDVYLTRTLENQEIYSVTSDSPVN